MEPLTGCQIQHSNCCTCKGESYWGFWPRKRLICINSEIWITEMEVLFALKSLTKISLYPSSFINFKLAVWFSLGFHNIEGGPWDCNIEISTKLSRNLTLRIRDFIYHLHLLMWCGENAFSSLSTKTQSH